MVVLKTTEELSAMREAGRITAAALAAAGEAIKAGMTTYELDSVIHKVITAAGATPSFLGYGGFPASACISINNEVIHGIPSKKRVIREGDIVSVDVGAHYKGFHGDSAFTFPVGKVSEKAQRLLDVTKESLYLAIESARSGNRLGDVGSTVQNHVEKNGFEVVREYVGHGVGRNLHEDPEVPNYGTAGRGLRLIPGMVIAIEPMVNEDCWEILNGKDGWTVTTKTGCLSAHFEHTVAITDNGPVILTKL